MTEACSASSCTRISGRVEVPSFPSSICHLNQEKVIFEANTVEISKRQIAFHCLAKIMRGRKEAGNDSGLHQQEDMTFLASPSLGSDPVAHAIHSMRYSLHNCRRTVSRLLKEATGVQKRSGGPRERDIWGRVSSGSPVKSSGYAFPLFALWMRG